MSAKKTCPLCATAPPRSVQLKKALRDRREIITYAQSLEAMVKEAIDLLRYIGEDRAADDLAESLANPSYEKKGSLIDRAMVPF